MFNRSRLLFCLVLLSGLMNPALLLVSAICHSIDVFFMPSHFVVHYHLEIVEDARCLWEARGMYADHHRR